ncbi:MAG TPA: TetR/AcrR family transcriptional regulator [Chryseolinea sp.]|nr:TetR/AcrR family transcriptional regulator [Chryseolinea sp.]HPM30630.1 TetR/AcrR family transcriptional regulator [Chryseolinea sp.]
MGVKERKERERIDMRQLILNSAHQLFLSKGFDEVSIRNIAEAIEYSPATIYLYFKDKNEIFHALHGEAFKKFNEYMVPVFAIKDPFKRLVTMGEKYIEFTFTHPKYYTIMFIAESPMQCEETTEGWIEGQRALDSVESIVAECIKAGQIKKQSAKVMAFTIWSYMHGMCSLALRDRMKHYTEEEREHMIEKSFKIFIQMLKNP